MSRYLNVFNLFVLINLYKMYPRYANGMYKLNNNVTRAELTGVVSNNAKEIYIDVVTPLDIKLEKLRRALISKKSSLHL